MISFLKRAEPVTLVRSPILTKEAVCWVILLWMCKRARGPGESGGEGHGFEAGEAGGDRRRGKPARREALHRLRDCRDLGGRRPAATAGNRDQPLFRPFLAEAGVLVRQLVIFADVVGKAGIGVRTRVWEG